MLRYFACSLFLLWSVAALAEPTFLWEQVYDGGGLYDDQGNLVAVSPAGHPVIAGSSHDGVEGSDMLVRMLDRTDGSEIWSRRIPAFDNSDMHVAAVAWDPSGDLLVGGHILGCVG